MNKLFSLIFVVCVFFQISFGQTATDFVVTVLDKETAIGSGVIVGANGYILTPFHLVKNVNQISIKLRNGEIYDDAKIIKKDERRNVALLQIVADGLKTLPIKSVEEIANGSKITIVSNASGDTLIGKTGTFIGEQLADNIQGAGNGYRVLLFDAKFDENLIGGLLLNQNDNPIGIVTTNPNMKQQNIAVPFSSISGLFSSFKPETAKTTEIGKSNIEIKPSEPPTKKVRQSAADVLKTAETVYVKSKTGFIKDSAFIAELMKNTDFAEWGWSFTNDKNNADLIIEVDRLALVIKFTFKVYSIKHGIIIASGNKHTNDFDFGSPDLVREIIKRIKLQKAIVR